MAASTDFKTYLATQVISDQKTVTYLHVSRALKVHVNAAKRMLYEFYERENGKKKGTVHATYLIAGVKHPRVQSNGQGKDKPTQDEGDTQEEGTATNGDSFMRSSPPPFTSSMPESSSSQQKDHDTHRRPATSVKVKTITLVREEGLAAIQSQYDFVSSIHLYSLSPGYLQDMQTITEVNRTLAIEVTSKEDPLVHYKTYGVIQNGKVHRRKAERGRILAAAVVSAKPKFQPVQDEKPSTAGTGKSNIGKADTANVVTRPFGEKQTAKKEEKVDSRPSSRDSTSTQDSKSATTSTSKPGLKRDGSNLFKAFAKQQQSSKPKLARKGTDASASASEVEKDIKMMDADEGQSDDDSIFLDSKKDKDVHKNSSKKRVSEAQKEKEERQAKLRKMMDSDDEIDTPSANNSQSAAAATDVDTKKVENEDGEDVAWSDSDTGSKSKSHSKATPAATAATTTTTTTEPKRRRGKRKVIRKRTTKDDEGFLVTKEEEAWESFSEDDTAAPSITSGNASSSAGNKGKNALSSMKKGASQTTKGLPTPSSSAGSTTDKTKPKKKDIMSFFGKK